VLVGLLDSTCVARRGKGRSWLSTHSLVENLKDTLWIFHLAFLVIIAGLLAVVEKNLVNDELPQDFPVKSVLLELEVEVLDASVARLIFLLMQLLEEGVLHCLLSTDSFSGIIAKKSAHEVECIFFNARE
jgi:hypothetical protein